jgi:hypothetical protein
MNDTNEPQSERSYDYPGSHEHCWLNPEPPCGKKAHARCCLCPKKNPDHEPQSEEAKLTKEK